MKVSLGLVLCCVAVLCVSACSTSRYSLKHDVGPSVDFDASRVPDAVPVWEAMSPKGNQSPYVVRGEEYHLLDQVAGYEEEGISSWYGLKFHGELTSNGEVYNMYAMSAAHKTLPLPAYLKVTNLDNKKSVIVRVNDRGPFHEGRIIDLSYAAAKKLGFEQKGTARVHLSAISVGKFEGEAQGSSGAASEKDRLSNFIQVAALSSEQGADKVAQTLSSFNLSYDVFVSKSASDHIFRVRVGPIDDLRQAESLRDFIAKKGVGSPLLIRRPVLAKGS